ncbi:MAG: ubiquitin-like domain-containing protein [Mycobacteriales bacterium]|nr:ubiquitin-like domain-containing protein [Mycobacteriales bacterium]
MPVSPALPAVSVQALRARVKRPAVLVLQAATLLALVGGTVGWGLTEKTVQLSVDGQVREVSLHGDTVSDVLDEAGLEVGEHDLLAPSVDTAVTEGATVALRRGRELRLVVDGVERSVWVTAASVAEALDQIGLGDRRAFLSASRSRSIGLEGLSLEVRLPKDVDILVDGKVKEISTTALTVRDALIEAGVVLRPKDRLTPARAVPVVDGLAITVARVDGKRVTEDFPIAFKTVRKDYSSLFKGETKVLQRGRHGVLRRTYTVGLVDGKRVSKLMSREVRVSEPVERIIAVGTKPRPSYGSRSVSGADDLNWPALARCESGGNPRAVSSGGTYRGLYQFSMSTWRGVGGSGDPIDASSAEQTYRAKLLYKRSGRSPWPHCGRYL